jgi:hypothetical protein
MPTNNGNVTRAAVGVAKRLWGRLKSILEAFVLGVKHGPFWHKKPPAVNRGLSATVTCY